MVGLVVLGPERLPGAIRWAASALRQARDYLSGVTSQLREDIGPEFDDLRGHLGELQKLRGMTPRAALTKHLLDGDDSLFTGDFDRPTPKKPDAAGSAGPDATEQIGAGPSRLTAMPPRSVTAGGRARRANTRATAAGRPPSRSRGAAGSRWRRPASDPAFAGGTCRCAPAHPSCPPPGRPARRCADRRRS